MGRNPVGVCALVVNFDSWCAPSIVAAGDGDVCDVGRGPVPEPFETVQIWPTGLDDTLTS